MATATREPDTLVVASSRLVTSMQEVIPMTLTRNTNYGPLSNPQLVVRVYRARNQVSMNRLASAARYVIVLSVGCFGVVLGCNDHVVKYEQIEYVTTTTLGDTCGNWQTSPDGTSPADRLVVTCGDGLICGHEESASATKELGNDFGICMPASGYQCDTSYETLCSDPLLVCIIDIGMPPGQCFYRCDAHSDCVGPHQVCYTGGCQFITCERTTRGGDDLCPYRSHCDMDLAVCVPD
jgi:hypothetical protein